MDTSLLNLLFVAQILDAVNYGAGVVMLLAALGCIGMIGFGVFKIAHHQALEGIASLVVAVILAGAAVAIVNSVFHGVGGSTVTITASAVD